MSNNQTQKPKMYYGPSDLKKLIDSRDATALAWSMFVSLIFCQVLILIIFICPGWAWTLEVHAYTAFEGSMFGYYGLWYSCWSLSSRVWDSDAKTECELMLDLKRIPYWWKICQGLAMCMLLLGVTVLVVTGAYCCVKTISRNIRLVTSIIIMCVIQVLLAIALLTVWCVLFLNSVYWCCPSASIGSMQMLEWKLNYCFVICCTLPFFYGSTIFMGLKEIYNLKEPQRLEEYHRKVASTRKKFEEAIADYQGRPMDRTMSHQRLMQAYHPGLRESYMGQPALSNDGYGPVPTQPYDGPTPALFGPPETQQYQMPLRSEALQQAPETPKEKPLGPDELDLTAELAY